MVDTVVPTGVTLVVLSGGESKRMGVDKATLRLGGRTLLDQMLTNLAESFDAVIVSTGPGKRLSRSDVQVVEDPVPGAGPLTGMHAALRESHTSWHFCVACDMPFLKPDVARILYQHVGDFPDVQVVLPRLPKGVEPLAGLYRKDCWPVFERTIQSGARRIVSAIADLRLVLVDETAFSGDPFFNVNTQEDLKIARAMLA